MGFEGRKCTKTVEIATIDWRGGSHLGGGGGDARVLIRIDYLARGKTIAARYYRELLDRLDAALKRKAKKIVEFFVIETTRQLTKQ